MPIRAFLRPSCMPRALPGLVAGVSVLAAGLLTTLPSRAHQQAAPRPAALAAPAAPAATTTTDWFSIELMGQRAGWCRQSEKHEGSSVTSEAEMEFAMGRADTPLKVRLSTTFVESTDGVPLRMSLRREMAASPVTEEYVFTTSGVDVTTISRAADGKEVRSTAHRSFPAGAWLTPAEATALSKTKMLAGENTFSITTVDPSSGLEVVKVEHTRAGEEVIKIAGKSVNVTRWNIVTRTSSGIDLASSEYVDASGNLIRSVTQLGGIGMTMTRDTEAIRGKKTTPPEVMVSLFVTPDHQIEHPRDRKHATYVVSVSEGDISMLPTTGSQTFTKLDAHSARVTVNTAPLAAAAPEDLKNPAYLENSSMITKDDPKVKGLLPLAFAKGRPESAAARAETLRQFVYSYITNKDLGMGFAGAAEVAQTRAGDCTEHGALLAALLRADGIPSRTVSGLIYADEFAGKRGIFGYHMWAQALIESDGAARWVDLDATLAGSAHAFDATHLAVSVNALSDGELNNSVMNLVPLLGRLQIKVEKVE